jgi:hypothetical protein
MDTIDRFEQQYDSSDKSFKGKIISGAKERATKQYFKDTASRARRKQGKQNYDTFRRDEQPNEEDIQLEDIHFANFLGLKYAVNGVPYNNINLNYPVNLNECDMFRPETEEFLSKSYLDNDTESETNSLPDENSLGEYEAEWSDKREKALTGFKDEEEKKKRLRDADIFESMVTYMRQQVELAQQIAANELYKWDGDK